jgi:hypothetical protein
MAARIEKTVRCDSSAGAVLPVKVDVLANGYANHFEK